MGADHSRKAFNKTNVPAKRRYVWVLHLAPFTCHISKYVLSFYQPALLWDHVKYPEKLLLLLHAKGTELLVELAT